MKILLKVILITLLLGKIPFAQTLTETLVGEVTFVSSQNIYVKFENTEQINVGDTLYSKQANKFIPAVKIEYLSSSSVAGKNLLSTKIKIGSELIYSFATEVKPEYELVLVPILNDNIVEEQLNFDIKKTNSKSKSNNIQGRVSISSYGNFSSTKAVDYFRWRYTFSARSQNFNSSRFSFDSYISFNYRSTEWNYIKNNISDALKIYSLAVNYQVSNSWDLTLGRKINRNLTNIGAIDGLQIQGKLSDFTTGFVIGSRPDYINYTYNFNLFEYGGYIAHMGLTGYGLMQNSLAIFQQTNDFKTDRRFLYFQHSSNFIRPMNFFFTTEVDLFKKENGQPTSDFSLTGIYASLKYKPIKELGLTGSYDSRKNVVYYETYQNYADSLYEAATRQGFSFRANIRPINNLFFYLSYGSRSRTGDYKSSQNYSGNIAYSKLPFINGTLSASYNNWATSYLNGKILGFSYSGDLFSGVLFTTLSLRKINYEYLNGSPNLEQTIVSIDLNIRIVRKLSTAITYEGTFEQKVSYGRVYFNLTKRF